MLSILDDLIIYFKQTNNNSLLARIYGIFTITTNVFKEIDVMIMRNTAVLLNDDSPVMMFDLKGSTANRYIPFQGKEKYWWKDEDRG